jgi:predicted ABC-class ATPase
LERGGFMPTADTSTAPSERVFDLATEKCLALHDGLREIPCDECLVEVRQKEDQKMRRRLGLED